MFKENYNVEPAKKGGESQFLKKKKIVYNYLKNVWVPNIFILILLFLIFAHFYKRDTKFGYK